MTILNQSLQSANRKRSKSGSKSRVSHTEFNAITRRYRELYKKAWCDKSTATKKRALDRAIDEKSTEIYTEDVFYQEFARRVDLLLDSTHFCDAVKRLIPTLKPYDVATHIVVLGWEELERVLLYEGYKDLKPFPEWGTPILERKDLQPYLEKRDNDDDAQSQETATPTV